MLSRLGEDLRALRHLFPTIRRGSHQERLESFYGGQADLYDGFRERLLSGRRELIDGLPLESMDSAVWVDFGGGTAANLEWAGSRLDRLGAVYVVDLCPSLLAVARRRIENRGWRHVHAVEAEAARFVPPEGKADLITFSYSLTMMPDWLAVLDQALGLLRPGGLLGAVDFYVSRKYDGPGETRHGWVTRAAWPLWFSFDDVYLNPDHLGELRRRLRTLF